jgi:hypothetical protein
LGPNFVWRGSFFGGCSTNIFLILQCFCPTRVGLGPIKTTLFAGPHGLPLCICGNSSQTCCDRRIFTGFFRQYSPTAKVSETTTTKPHNPTMAALQAYRHLMRAARIAFEGTKSQQLFALAAIPG